MQSQSKKLAQQIAARIARVAQKQALALFKDSSEFYEQEAQDVISTPGIFPNESGDIIWSGDLKRSQQSVTHKGKTTVWWDPKSKKGYGYAPRVVSGFKAWGNGRQVVARDFGLLAAQKTQQAGGNIEYRGESVAGEKVIARLKIRRLKVNARVKA
jgi:hypothetical protein